jgi:hypothetical protein
MTSSKIEVEAEAAPYLRLLADMSRRVRESRAVHEGID